MHIATVSDPRYAALAARDAAMDGQFFYSVKTTGVYCRPSCGAKLPRPENVGFHASCAAAEAAGFRPCKRCKPNQTPLQEAYAAVIAAACRRIESAEQVPTLHSLAAASGMSDFHFHRVFKAVTGVTPKAYATAHRANAMRVALAAAPSVTEAIYDAGFNSSGRFYANTEAALGMTPTAFRAKGAGADIKFAVGASSLGAILVARSQKGICAIALGDDPDELTRDFQDRYSAADLIGDDPEFAAMVAHVVAFVEAPQLGLDLPLDIQGTVFQQRVWQALRDIPAGKTVTYTDIAGKIGRPTAVRAVATACAANTLAVAIPCHRVIRTDGSLSGYRWGVARKRGLLDREASAKAAQ